MRGRTAVGIDDDLAPSQARVAIRSTDHELARGVYPPFSVAGNPAIRQDIADIGFHHGANIAAGHAFVQMLGRQHDGRHAHRFSVTVHNCQLRFCIGTKRRLSAVFADLSKAAQDRVGVLDRRGHQLGRFVHSIAEHDTLIASALIPLLTRDALSDMGGLLVQQVQNVTGAPVEFLLLVPDVLDTITGDAVDLTHVFGQFVRVGQANFAPYHNLIGRRECLDGHARQRVLCQKGIKDGIRNPVTDFIRVALRDGLRGKGIVLSLHRGCAPLGYAVTPGSRCDG